MRASRENARAARLQLGKANDLAHDLANLDSDDDRLRGGVESIHKLFRDVRAFLQAAERVLPSEAEYAGKAAKKQHRESQPVG